MKKQITAAVYRQLTPQVVKPVKYFMSEDGSRFMEHRINLEHVTDVTGSYDECWAKAREVCDLPVLEFPRGMYKGMNHE